MEPDSDVRPTWTKLGLSYEQFMTLPPMTRWALDREHNPQPVKPRRPVYRTLTPAELEELAATGLTGPARTEWARARQQTPLPQSQG